MSIEKVLESVDSDLEAVRFVNSFMTSNARKDVESHIPMIRKMLLEMRAEIDPIQQDIFYPDGYCLEINNEAFDRMSGRESIRNLTKRGVVFKKLWGIYKNAFHNAIQLGHLFISACDDSIDSLAQPVRISNVDQSGFQEITTYSCFIDTAEKYWKVKAIPNYVLPFFSGVNPFIFVEENGSVCFNNDHQMPLLAGDIRKDFEGAKKIMRRLEGKKLTEQQLTLLLEPLQQGFKVFYRNNPDKGYLFEPRNSKDSERTFDVMIDLWKSVPSFPKDVFDLSREVLG